MYLSACVTAVVHILPPNPPSPYTRHLHKHLRTCIQVYAAPVLDRLDPTGAIFQSRFFRGSCSPFGNVFLKDLRVVGRDMSRCVCLPLPVCLCARLL